MKNFISLCRFWFGPLTLAPLVVLSVMQENWLALGASITAVLWAAAFAVANSLITRIHTAIMAAMQAIHKASE